MLHITRFPAPNLCHDWLFIIGFYQPAANGLFASMHPAGRVSKFAKKYVRRASLCNDMAEYDIRHRLHGRKNKKRFRKFLPEVSH